MSMSAHLQAEYNLGRAKSYKGSASPEALVTGDIGDIYVRTNGEVWNKLTGNNTNTGWYCPLRIHTATPEAAITAPVGTLCVNTAGGASTTLYVKTSGTGNTGWTAK